MGCPYCISLILSDFVCFLCRSLSFLRQFFYFSVLVSRSFSFLRHCCLIVFRSSTVFRQFFTSLFALSVILCLSSSVLLFLCLCQSFFLFLASLLSNCISIVHCISSILFVFVCFLCCSLRFFVSSLILFVFVSRSFSFLRHCSVIVFRSSTVFRQFSTSLFSFSVVLCLSSSVLLFLCLCQSFFLFLASLLSNCISIVHCTSSILFAFVCVLCCSLRFFVSSLIFLYLSVVPSRSCVTAVQLYFVLPLYFVNSLRPCLLSLSFFAFLCQSFNFVCLCQSFFLFLASLLPNCNSIVHCTSSILYVLVCFLCHSLRFFVSPLIFQSLSIVLSLSCLTAL